MRLSFIIFSLLFCQIIQAQSADSSWQQTQTISEERITKNYVPVFSSPRLINANTVELIPKGIMAFKVTHNFGDMAGDNGGAKNFFGLDNATDIRIGFQFGVGENLNLVVARAKGASSVRQLYETGIKYRLMRQTEDNIQPLSMTLYANNVIAATEASIVIGDEHAFENFGDRMSQLVQLMIARRMGIVSIQLNPSYVHRGMVIPGDQQNVFAMGGAIRIPVKGRFSILADYFHPFRNDEAKAAYQAQGIELRDILGVGIELLTEGHVFHLNFTNATEILENRFIPRTITSWSDGAFRWGFTVSRDFNLKKRNRNK